ncbi:AAA family ATPase [Halorussus amylolyticus]|uniref:AAA family ATPase n=1 Tax=Halorussus amylolyticus TaxID=1126242 RepID=UPI00104DB486|nr:AAA family ATPase [Halorussus amylolyticus]
MILVVCGPPGVGKTTIANRLHDRLRAAGRDFEILHSDDFSSNTYGQLFERVRDDPEADWILDGTFFERATQERFRSLPDAHLVSVAASLETCLKRNRERENPIEQRGVHAMHANFDVPRNPDLTLDTERLSATEATDALERYVETWLDDN